MGRGGPNGPSSLFRLRLQSSDSNRPCRHHFSRLFSFQTERGICLCKIMYLGLAYSLASTFLSSGPALALAKDKNPAKGVLPWKNLVGEVGLIGVHVDRRSSTASSAASGCYRNTTASEAAATVRTMARNTPAPKRCRSSVTTRRSTARKVLGLNKAFICTPIDLF